MEWLLAIYTKGCAAAHSHAIVATLVIMHRGASSHQCWIAELYQSRYNSAIFLISALARIVTYDALYEAIILRRLLFVALEHHKRPTYSHIIEGATL